MAKGRFIKKTSAYVAKKVGVRGGIFIGGTATGAVMGLNNAPPGFRREGLKEGAIGGAALSTGFIFAPKLVKATGNGLIKQAKKAASKGAVAFRRIRGRIVPIKTGK